MYSDDFGYEGDVPLEVALLDPSRFNRTHLSQLLDESPEVDPLTVELYENYYALVNAYIQRKVELGDLVYNGRILHNGKEIEIHAVFEPANLLSLGPALNSAAIKFLKNCIKPRIPRYLESREIDVWVSVIENALTELQLGINYTGELQINLLINEELQSTIFALLTIHQPGTILFPESSFDLHKFLMGFAFHCEIFGWYDLLKKQELEAILLNILQEFTS